MADNDDVPKLGEPIREDDCTHTIGDLEGENPSHLHFGFGRCSKCNCMAFEGRASTCANRGCGHAFADHY